MARHRRGLPLGVDHDNLYMEDAELLAGRRARADEKERREEHRAEHEVIVPPRPADVNAIPVLHVRYDSARCSVHASPLG